MPICPKCHNEYREGFVVCTECKCDLVDSLDELPGKGEALEVIYTGEENICLQLKDFLDYNKFNSVVEEALNETGNEGYNFVLKVDEAHADKAKRAVMVFLRENATSTININEIEEIASEMSDSMQPTVYRKKEDKAKDMKSSAFALILVGILGLLCLLAMQMNWISLTLGNNVLAKVVLPILFVLFLVLGISSLFTSKRLASEGVKENELTSRVNEWCMDNLTREAIESRLESEEYDRLSEEMKFFRRTELMKNMISASFMNLDSAFLDNLIEEHYDRIYGED